FPCPVHPLHLCSFPTRRSSDLRMKLNRWIVLPAAGLAAVIIGVAAVEAAPSPSASSTGSKNYAQVFVDKLAGILHLTPAQTQDADRKSTRLNSSHLVISYAVFC